ncbi:aryl-alcohol dehydrogenase-like predicted oxidoreductase [Wenyingzhuangia heitensis]|uniref:Aryl-alcohol dehydrogenase-like predicted oxidoreductase n=1 Tax=Wenyingzhuangia heitensis TaxID=1487859 RepID=A0ABX0UBZ3_9FLAO|nr:aldo/keto reductase [Wenyingzhuangia heitensis]NIJ46349.1 aryl-alcohol dehydrogenase-like predicted oxidoreductase [Wenyingzhuangia heitensis]
MTKIGLGLAALGRPEYINIRENKDLDKSESSFKKNAFDMLDTAYSINIHYFDTAPSYGKGEEFLKEWQNKNNHTNTVLATKWGYTYVANWELGYKGAHEIKEHSIEKLIEQWETSKVMIPALKVYQIHSATLESGVLENNKVLKKLSEIKKETGLQIGLTTSGPNQEIVLKEAASIKINNQFLFDVFQVTYNVFEQSTFNTLVDLIRKGKNIVIKEGIANGRIFKNTPTLLTDLALKHNVGIDAIALRFIIDSLQPYIVLSGAFTKHQLQENLKCLTIKLTSDELKTLSTLETKKETYWSERKELSWN